MKKITKIIATTSMVTAFGIGVAGTVIGTGLASEKTKNAQIDDYGNVSLLTKHLFNVDQKDYKTLDQVAQKNAAGKKGINILNIGDSVAHGDYTWQILDDIRDKDNEHYLKDGPPRIGSYYGFLADALRKNGKVGDDYHINYDTSVSGLRMFELLNWFKTHKYIPMTDEANSDNVRSFDKSATDHYHSEVNEENNKMIEKIKDNDVVTMSIGGNDLIRCIKLFGKPFHDSFDTSTWGDKLKDALKSGNLGDVIKIDMDSLADILKEMEENLQSTLQLIHMINPGAKVMMFETAFPFEHFPKVIRNAMAPLYSKVKEMTKRVMKINVTKNDGVSPDVHGVVHSIYDQTEIDTDSENHKAGEIVQSKEEQEKSGLNWASYTSIDFTGSENGDPNDVYKANSIDIHPTIEGQGRIGQAMFKTMQEKFGLSSKDTYTDKDVADRVDFVRALHQGVDIKDKAGKITGHREYTQEEYLARVKELNKQVGNTVDIEADHISDDSVYDVPSDGTNNRGVKLFDADGNPLDAIEIEKKENKFYTITRDLFGAIDAFTDRVYLRDDLAFKKLDYSKSTTLKSYDEYESKIKDFEHKASFLYDEYSRSLDLTKPENKQYAGTGGIAIKLWKNEATNWLINIADKGTSDSEYQALVKNFGFDFGKYTESIQAYKDARKLMFDQQSLWDQDKDGRFTLSDIQLGDVSSLKLSGAITGLGGVLDQITSWTDFNIMWTRAFTDSFTGAALTRPDYTSKSVLGRVTLGADEMYAHHMVSGAGHFDITNGIGAKTADLDKNGEVKLGQKDSTINRLKNLLGFLSTNKDIGTTISDFINDHADDLKDWAQDAIDFIKDIDIAANKNVVYDFMENLMADFGTVDKLLDCVEALLKDPNVQAVVDPMLKDYNVVLMGKPVTCQSVVDLLKDTGMASARGVIGMVEGKLGKMSDDQRRERFGSLFAEYTQKLMDIMFGSSTPADDWKDTMLKEFEADGLKTLGDIHLSSVASLAKSFLK